MDFRISILVALLIAYQGMPVAADQPDVAERVLNNRLNNLESQAIQRQTRGPRLQDLLARQDDRIAGQALNALKTKRPRSTAVPLLERKLNRSRSRLRPFDHR